VTTAVDAQQVQQTSEVSLVIRGMTCGACAARIEQRLNRLDGVEARVNYATERATAVLAAGIRVEQLLEEIASAGYSADPPRGASNSPAAGEDEARLRSLRRRLLVSGLLFMPLCDTSLGFSMAPNLRFDGWQWLMLALATPVVTWAAWPFYGAALRAARHGLSTMDTLVTLGIVSSTAWSLYSMFWGRIERHAQGMLSIFTQHSADGLYLDVAAGVTTFLLVGRYFEAWSRKRSGDALRSLAAVGARDAGILDATGAEHRRPVAELRVGDRFIVRPGETVPAEGNVLEGRSAIDRSVMTGEFEPLEVGVGDAVTAGTVSLTGRLIVRATRVGADTQLAQMLKLVEQAQNEKAAVQRLADRVANVFVPGVLLVAFVTMAAWLTLGYPAQTAFTAALSVLVIACPCALGLATPAALYVASGEGAKVGIFFKGYRALEASRQVDTVIFDKTGTVTQGTMSVTDISCAPGQEPASLLRWAGAVEQASEHPVARAIAARAVRDTGSLPDVVSFVALTGLGASGEVDGHRITVGRARLYDDAAGLEPVEITDRCRQWEQRGDTAVRVYCDGRTIGACAVSDTIRPSAGPAVRRLQELGLRCVLMTGDSQPTALAVAGALGITEVVSGALPAEKVAVIRRLQAEGHAVAMVGDGVNDAPALVVADLGLAVGSGTDVALNAADLIVVRDDLVQVANAIVLARRTLRTIHGNLAWACLYNLAALPLAAFGLLNPLLAAAAMALSSGFVVWNSSRLRNAARRGAARGRRDHSGARNLPDLVLGAVGHG
jgi:P-type Cu+ transporter